ncbi:MAG: putative serine/threonine phosphoprotein phosphatase [Chlamydiales bacterium]|jgi:protein phosphatase|nr:putative serine/threonine phosphoprotein phosphatase [Chlamydiales bacterium]
MGNYNTPFYGLSDIGLVRKVNQDLWASLPEHRYFVLADGMGGHQAGEVAAKEAVENLVAAFKATGGTLRKVENHHVVADFVRDSIEKANRAVYNMGKQNSQLEGMGTTICSLYVHHRHVIYAHVGDSRIYCFRNGELKLLTQDHTLLQEFENAMQDSFSHERATCVKYKHVLTQAIGINPKVKPAVGIKTIVDGDIYLLCSDGLSDGVSHETIQAILTENSLDLEQATQKLIQIAKQAGGKDNITAILTRLELVTEEATIAK